MKKIFCIYFHKHGRLTHFYHISNPNVRENSRYFLIPERLFTLLLLWYFHKQNFRSDERRCHWLGRTYLDRWTWNLPIYAKHTFLDAICWDAAFLKTVSVCTAATISACPEHHRNENIFKIDILMNRKLFRVDIKLLTAPSCDNAPK